MKNFFLESDIVEIVDGIQDIAQQFSGKTFLLTGGCGFLGRYFSKVFNRLNDDVLDKPCKMIVIDNLITADMKMELPAASSTYRFIQYNIIKPLSVDEKVDFVVHAAGIAIPYYYRAYPLEALDVATIGTRNMLEVTRANSTRFLFFSSSEIYGDPDPAHIPTQESYRGNLACQGPGGPAMTKVNGLARRSAIFITRHTVSTPIPCGHSISTARA